MQGGLAVKSQKIEDNPSGQWGLPPEDAASRQARAVARLDIVGTPPEERFDRITRMARLMLAAPISTLAIFDGDTAWFKSVDGFARREVPLREAFCAVTGQTRERLVVNDAVRDPRFRSLPDVAGKANLRFYAGQPLLDRNGQVVGSFCVYDVVPRVFTPEQEAAFAELAAWAQAELLQTSDMERAREVQKALLPVQVPRMAGYAMAATSLPSFHIGGDYYDWLRTDYGTAIGLADVMGKGTAAAIMSATTRSGLRTAAELTRRDADGRFQLGRIMSNLGRILSLDLARADMFVTVFLAHLEQSTGRVDFADAGHGFCLVTAPDGSFRRVSGDGLPLGIDPEGRWSQSTFTLDPGETMLIFSDGLFDLFGGTSTSFEGIAQLMAANQDPQKLVDTIAVLASAGTSLDDVTAVAVRRTA